VHASFALSDAGFETVMVNCNPETVSTDYDTSDRLYFEPLTCEDVLEVVHAEQRSGELVGVIVQLGGQTPLGLAARLTAAGVPIVGTSADAIHLAEERGAFGRVLAEAGLTAPRPRRTVGLRRPAGRRRGGYQVSGPRRARGAVEIVYDDGMLADYIGRATQVSPEHPVLVDRFLDDAIEIDVDALFDGEELYLGGVMEHIEEAGIHSGDSACVLPPVTLGAADLDRVRRSTEAIARGIGVRGLLNVQFALAQGVLYVLEANPRASRTAPFVSKATAVPPRGGGPDHARRPHRRPAPGGELPPPGTAHLPVDSRSGKEAVLPFKRFRTVDGLVVDSLLGPEMRSTGEVMGIDVDFPHAFAKSQSAAYGGLPDGGRVFVSIADVDKRAVVLPVKRLADLGFEVLATAGTAQVLRRNGIPNTVVRKHSQGPGPDGEPTIVERILAGDVDIVVNTPSGPVARADGYEIRAATTSMDRPIITTMQQLAAAVQAIEAARNEPVRVTSLQEHAAVLAAARSFP
jgi:carbamoyl-phosphate synthase large subunit